MKHTTVHECRIVDIRKYTDNRGYLSVIEGGEDIPFEIKRIYYLYMVPEAARGAHAHKELQQLLIATSGSVDITLDDGHEKKTFHLDRLTMPKTKWHNSSVHQDLSTSPVMHREYSREVRNTRSNMPK